MGCKALNVAIGKLLVVGRWQASVRRLFQLRAVEGAVVLPELQAEAAEAAMRCSWGMDNLG
jgi:hypothetical protein